MTIGFMLRGYPFASNPGGCVVTFAHVSFSYQPAAEVLYDISLAITSGQMLAVKGQPLRAIARPSRFCAIDRSVGGARADGGGKSERVGAGGHASRVSIVTAGAVLAAAEHRHRQRHP
jgi:hypothetical protein